MERDILWIYFFFLWSWRRRERGREREKKRDCNTTQDKEPSFVWTIMCTDWVKANIFLGVENVFDFQKLFKKLVDHRFK